MTNKPTMIKMVLYVDDDQFQEVLDFYHECLGLAITNTPNLKWIEFETGSFQLCLHHNNLYDGEKSSLPTRTNIVLRGGTEEEITKKHERLLAIGYHASTEKYRIKHNEIGCLYRMQSKERKGTLAFFVMDPVGNIIQVEAD